MITLPKIIDWIAAHFIKRSERKPDDESHETTNDIIKFRSRMWCDGKQRDF